ncbi:hypothetical protein M758_12G164900 [Ceratodon purpureus]|nr:hypothetical protein M758_12G164900 [Ceratodon purpureus]
MAENLLVAFQTPSFNFGNGIHSSGGCTLVTTFHLETHQVSPQLMNLLNPWSAGTAAYMSITTLGTWKTAQPTNTSGWPNSLLSFRCSVIMGDSILLHQIE